MTVCGISRHSRTDLPAEAVAAQAAAFAQLSARQDREAEFFRQRQRGQAQADAEVHNDLMIFLKVYPSWLGIRTDDDKLCIWDGMG